MHVVGGGARNPLRRRILAVVRQRPVVLFVEPESAALGAAIAAAWTVRRLPGEKVAAHAVAEPFVRSDGDTAEPDPSLAVLYADMGQRLRDLTGKIFG